MSLNLIDGTPAGSVRVNYPLGQIQGEIFKKGLNHIINCRKPTAFNLVLLGLDGTYRRTRNVDITDMVHENLISIASLSSHSTYKMQSFSVGSTAPLKFCHSQDIETWLRTTLKGS